jgi:hypothetical protein
MKMSQELCVRNWEGGPRKILFNTSNADIFPGAVHPNEGETDLWEKMHKHPRSLN